MSFRQIHGLKYMDKTGLAEVEARHVVLEVHGALHAPRATAEPSKHSEI